MKKRFIHDETNYSTHNPKLKQLWLVELTHNNNKKKSSNLSIYINLFWYFTAHNTHYKIYLNLLLYNMVKSIKSAGGRQLRNLELPMH